MASGGFSKRHVSGMLKHLEDDQQKARAVEVQTGFKTLFADKKWGPIMAKMRDFAAEDHLRIAHKQTPPSLKTTTSAPPVLLDGQSEITPPPHFLTAVSEPPSTSSPLPRERWDKVTRGPMTPLTPTPTGNAFAPGGFWGSKLTPTAPATSTPITAIPRSPYSPSVPHDIEARAAYDQVKHDVETMARTICANRLSVRSKITDSDDIPRSLISHKDRLKGATITLQYRQIATKSVIDPAFLTKLAALAVDEIKIVDQYSIRDMSEFLDVDTWLQVDEATLQFTTMLDAQRELLHMHRNRRKSSLMNLPERAIHLAWALCMLEDAERGVDIDWDTDSDNSDETGYEYNNFLRSFKTESSSDVSLLANTDSLRSTASIGESLRALSREQSMEAERDVPHWLSFKRRERGESDTTTTSGSSRTLDRLAMRSRENSALSVSPSTPSMGSRRTSPMKPNELALKERGNSNMIDSPDHRSSKSSGRPNELALRSRQNSGGSEISVRLSTSPTKPNELTLRARENSGLSESSPCSSTSPKKPDAFTSHSRKNSNIADGLTRAPNRRPGTARTLPNELAPQSRQNSKLSESSTRLSTSPEKPSGLPMQSRQNSEHSEPLTWGLSMTKRRASPEKLSDLVLQAQTPSFIDRMEEQRAIRSPEEKPQEMPLRAYRDSKSNSNSPGQEKPNHSVLHGKTSGFSGNPSRVHSMRKLIDLTLGSKHAGTSPTKQSASSSRTRPMPVNTDISATENDTDRHLTLSPEERAFRRGVSILDLDNWAQQLKEMEEQRDERTMAREQQMNSRGHMRTAASRQMQTQHPALRTKDQEEEEVDVEERKSSNAGSDKSWTCKTASLHERGASTSSISQRLSNDSATNQKRKSAGHALNANLPLPLPRRLSTSTISTNRRSSPPSPARSTFYLEKALSPVVPSGRRGEKYEYPDDIPPTPATPTRDTFPVTPTPTQSNFVFPPHSRPESRTSNPAATPIPTHSSTSRSSSRERTTTRASANLHNEVRRSQHVRSKGSIAEEDEWARELGRMEGAERIRQMEEFYRK